MTDDEVKDLVKDCGLDWHKGFFPFADYADNSYALLIEKAQEIEREACARVCEAVAEEMKLIGLPAGAIGAGACADAIRGRK